MSWSGGNLWQVEMGGQGTAWPAHEVTQVGNLEVESWSESMSLDALRKHQRDQKNLQLRHGAEL